MELSTSWLQEFIAKIIYNHSIVDVAHQSHPFMIAFHGASKYLAPIQLHSGKEYLTYFLIEGVKSLVWSRIDAPFRSKPNYRRVIHFTRYVSTV